MTTYRVQSTDRIELDIVEADEVRLIHDGQTLLFARYLPDGSFVTTTFDRWRQWAVVHDEADTVHL